MTDTSGGFGGGGGRSEGDYAASLARPSAGPSRRQVTVLFSDLVGWTGICEELDAEVAREILGAYHERCGASVVACGGSVGQFLGDGILAFFGHPVAYEDNGYRAVLAGLRIVNEVGDLTRQSARAYGCELAVRVGIHSGLVVAEELVGTEAHANVVGSPLNLTHRIQSEAAPGTVFISEATYELVQGWFEVVPEGRHTLRGVAAPMPLYRVLRPTGAETRSEASPHRSSLVGRETELRTLVSAWERATAGGVHGLVVVGDAGIGKSRLLEAAQSHVATTGGGGLILQCSPHHLNSAFHPLARMVDRRAPGLGAGCEEHLELLAGLLDVGTPNRAASLELTPEQRRELIFGAFGALLRDATRDQPLLLVVEDLHWADPSTAELLTRVLGAVDIDRVLVAMTTRPRSGPSLGEEVTTLELAPLPTEHRLELVEDVSAGAPLSANDRALISRRSDGVPLYIEELTRMLARDESEGGHGRGGPGVAQRVPSTLQDLLTARLDQFPREKSVAQLVAAVGPSAPVPLLQRLLGFPQESDVRAAVAPLVDARILQETDERISTSLSFRHSLLRDAAYESQLHSERRTLHRRIAEILDESFPAIVDAEPERLAAHLFEGGEHGRAAGLWARAGQRLAGQAAHAEAAAHYRSALDALQRSEASGQHPDPAFEVAIQTGLGYSLLPLQGYTSAEGEAAFRTAADLASTAPGGVDVATRFGLWAYHIVVGDHGLALSIAEQCLASAEASGREDERLQANSMLGIQHFYMGTFDAARACLEVGAGYDFPEDQTPTPQDPAVASLVILAPLLWMTGQPTEARSALDAGLARAQELAFPVGPFTRAYAHAYAAWFYQLASDPVGSAEHARITIDISEEYGFATWLAAGSFHQAIAASWLGPLEAAVASIEAAVAAWQGAGANLFLPYLFLSLADARRRAGDPIAARRAVDEGLAHTTRRNERFMEAELLRLRGELVSEMDPEHPEAAEGDLLAAVAVARKQGARAFELRAATSLHALRESPESAEMLRQVLGTFDPGAKMREVDEARAVWEGAA